MIDYSSSLRGLFIKKLQKYEDFQVNDYGNIIKN